MKKVSDTFVFIVFAVIVFLIANNDETRSDRKSWFTGFFEDGWFMMPLSTAIAAALIQYNPGLFFALANSR